MNEELLAEARRRGLIPPGQGMLSPGNIDLHNRPTVKNPDGSISTVRSISANFDGKEVLIPTVSDDGRIMQDEEAIQNYLKTGKNLGSFSTPQEATAYAESLHEQQANEYLPKSAAPQVDPGLLAEAQRRGLIPAQSQPEKGFGQGIADSFNGNAAEDIRSINEYEFNKPDGSPDMMTALKMLPSGALGSDEDKARQFMKMVPGATMTKDANGNDIIETDQGRFYVNEPGLDRQDVMSGITKAASFLPAGRLVKAGGTLLAKLGLGAAGAGATDIGMQAASGRNIDQYDPVQTATTAALGSAGELAGPLFGAVTRGVKSTAAKFASPESLVAAGKKIAAEAGIPGNLGDDVYKALAQRSEEIAGGASPASVLSEVELGTNLSKGQKTGDYAQQRLEETLKSRADGSGAVLREADAANQNAIEAASEKLRTQLGANPSSQADAAQQIQSSIQQQHATAKQGVREAYDAARAKNAVVPTDVVETLPGRARAAVEDMGLDPALHPAAVKSLEVLDSTLGALKADGKLTGLDLKKVENTRRILSSRIDAAANPADRMATTKIKKELDNWLDDAVDNAVIQGDAEAITLLKEARSARTKLHQRFEQNGKGDQAGRIVQKMISEDASPDQLAQMVFGAGKLSPAAASNVAKKVKLALGDDKEAWNAMRSAVLIGPTTKKTGEVVGPQAIVSNLKEMLRNRPALMKELYSPEELNTIQRFTMMVEPLVKKGGLAKSSGTTERAIAALSQGFGNVPIIGSLLNAVQAPRRFMQASGALGAVRPPLTSPIPGMAAPAAYEISQ